MGLAPRELYFLITCWLLTVSSEGEITSYTKEFQDMCAVFENSISKGIDGEVENVSSEECEREWEKVRPLVSELHGIYEGMVNEKLVKIDK
jgi:hypothetical protein